jgi:hypothetical protein
LTRDANALDDPKKRPPTKPIRINLRAGTPRR